MHTRENEPSDIEHPPFWVNRLTIVTEDEMFDHHVNGVGYKPLSVFLIVTGDTIQVYDTDKKPIAALCVVPDVPLDASPHEIAKEIHRDAVEFHKTLNERSQS